MHCVSIVLCNTKLICTLLLPANIVSAGNVFSVLLCVRVWSWENVECEKGINWIFPGVYMSVCLSFCLLVDRFCQHNDVTTRHDTIMKLNRCVVEISESSKDQNDYTTQKTAWSAWCNNFFPCLQITRHLTNNSNSAELLIHMDPKDVPFHRMEFIDKYVKIWAASNLTL